MKNKKKLYIFIPLILLITISCTCGGPNFKNLISSNNVSDIVEQVESGIQVPNEIQDTEEEPESEAAAPVVGTGLTGGDIEVFNVNHFMDNDYVTVIGLLQNNTNTMISGVDLSIILYDADGKIMATDSIYPSLSLLPPGEIVPFSTYSSDWQGFASYEFVVDGYYESDQEIVDGVVISNEQLSFDGYTPIMLGEIENNSSVPVEWVNAAVMVFDSNGILIDAVNTYAMLDIIVPGGKSPFKMYMNYGWEEFDRYDIVVQASEAYEEPADMLVTDYEVTEDDYSITFTGNIQNNSSDVVSYATVVASFYNSSGDLVAAEWTFAEEDDILPNGTGTFELTIWDDIDYSEVVFQVQ